MEKKKNRYQQMQTYITRAILLALIAFILYLIAAGAAITWLKVCLSIIILLCCAGILVFLYFCGELLRKRSLWMSASSAAIFLCTLMSLILDYPSPV